MPSNDQMRIPRTGIVVVASMIAAALAVYLVVLTRNELRAYDYIGRSEEQIYTITVSGEGKITAVPDIAQISLGVQTEKATVTEAQTENTRKMNGLVAAIKAQGVEDKDVKTTSYSIYPNYDWVNDRQVLRGYAISQEVMIKVRDLEKVGALIEVATAQGANQVGGLSFTIDDPEELKQQAREMALVKAKEKADALAKVAGAKLGRIVNFSESEGGYYPPMPYYGGDMMRAEAGMAVAEAPKIEAGSQDVIIVATVTYEIL